MDIYSFQWLMISRNWPDLKEVGSLQWLRKEGAWSKNAVFQVVPMRISFFIAHR